MSNLDLHMHSCFSDDGEFTPEEIIDMAISNNVKTISITDHNSVKSLERAVSYSKTKDINFIPGIEIDCTFNNKNLHLLGYNINYNNQCFYDLEKHILNQERLVAKEKVQKIKDFTKLNLDKNEVLRKSLNGVVTGELIAEILLEDLENRKSPILKPYIDGERSDMPFVNFYWDYFSQGKIAYVPINFINLKDAIKIIHETNGIAVLAHPGNNLKDNMDMIDSLISEGLDGIEVYSSYHTLDQIEYFYKKAIANDLILTCGSDFHGKTKPNISIGNFKYEPKDVSNIIPIEI